MGDKLAAHKVRAEQMETLATQHKLSSTSSSLWQLETVCGGARQVQFKRPLKQMEPKFVAAKYRRAKWTRVAKVVDFGLTALELRVFQAKAKRIWPKVKLVQSTGQS